MKGGTFEDLVALVGCELDGGREWILWVGLGYWAGGQMYVVVKYC